MKNFQYYVALLFNKLTNNTLSKHSEAKENFVAQIQQATPELAEEELAGIKDEATNTYLIRGNPPRYASSGEVIHKYLPLSKLHKEQVEQFNDLIKADTKYLEDIKLLFNCVRVFNSKLPMLAGKLFSTVDTVTILATLFTILPSVFIEDEKLLRDIELTSQDIEEIRNAVAVARHSLENLKPSDKQVFDETLPVDLEPIANEYLALDLLFDY